MKILKKVFMLLLITFIIGQFFGPEKNEGRLLSVNAFLDETNPPEQVKLILEKTCYDCHSNATQYPWYNNITPINYWMAHHVNEGKEELNFSNWVGNSVKRKDHKFEELIEMLEEKEMPLKSYTLMHDEAKLSDTEIQAVVDWARLVRITYAMELKPE